MRRLLLSRLIWMYSLLIFYFNIWIMKQTRSLSEFSCLPEYTRLYTKTEIKVSLCSKYACCLYKKDRPWRTNIDRWQKGVVNTLCWMEIPSTNISFYHNKASVASNPSPGVQTLHLATPFEWPQRSHRINGCRILLRWSANPANIRKNHWRILKFFWLYYIWENNSSNKVFFFCIW